jgi:hypothetical protein
MKRSDGKWWWLGLLGVVLLALGIIIGVAIAGSDSGPSTEGLRRDRLTHLVETGQAQDMLDQHQTMMEQMRVDATPQMLQLMDADPMWKIMRNGEFAQMMVDQQEQIDRMLGRGAP